MFRFLPSILQIAQHKISIMLSGKGHTPSITEFNVGHTTGKNEPKMTRMECVEKKTKELHTIFAVWCMHIVFVCMEYLQRW